MDGSLVHPFFKYIVPGFKVNETEVRELSYLYIDSRRSIRSISFRHTLPSYVPIEAVRTF